MGTLTDEQALKFATFAATILENPYIPHEPTSQQARFLMLEDTLEAFYGGAAGGGKALGLDTPLPTPSGWMLNRDVRVGDTVFSAGGKPVLVTHVFDVLQSPESYRVTFDDGSTIDACADHKWLTFDAKELAQLTRCDPGWRARRRNRRPRRGTGKRPDLAERNSRSASAGSAPMGTIRTTKEIFDTQRLPSGRSNHAIPVAGALDIKERRLDLDPYLLGVWLGDGTSQSGAITSVDAEIVEAFGCFDIHKRSGKYDYGTKGLAPVLRRLGVLGNKHIPNAYLRGSKAQRLAVLQGLMDTDGCVVCGSGVEFTSCNESLAVGVSELANSLGWKATVSTGRASLNGKDCGPKYRVKWTPDEIVFRLTRKAEAQTTATRRTTKFRYVKDVSRIESKPMRCISVQGGMYLAGRQMVPTHNSDALLMAALQYAHVPNYAALLLRKSYPDLALPGALMDRGREWIHGSDAKWDDKNKTWHFPSGASLTFGYLATETDKYRYKSAEFQFIGFDELTQFDEASYLYLFSRLRKSGDMKVPLRMRAASNPGDMGHAWTKSRFLTPEASEAGRVFIPAKVDDNPHIDQREYLNSLWQLTGGDEVTYKQLRYGDWDAFAGQVFNEWNPEAHICKPFEIPKGWMRFRSMDWGFATPYCVHWWAVDHDGRLYCYRELYGWGGKPNIGTRETATEVAEQVLKLSKDDGEFTYNTADPSIWGERGGTGPSIGEEFMLAGLPWMQADNNRMSGKHQVHKRLRGWGDGEPGIVFFDTCEHTIRTVPVLPADKNKPEDVDTRTEDHAYDSVRYACMSRPWANELPVPDRPCDAWDDDVHGEDGSFMAM